MRFLQKNSIKMGYRKIYKKEVGTAFSSQHRIKNELLEEKDLETLPEPVRKYIRYTGSVGRPKLNNVFIRADGKIRSGPNDAWMNFKSEQYNFFGDPSRFFYIKAFKAGMPAFGLHIYKQERATMQISLAGLLRIVNARGNEMNKGETVTLLNDMCFMAPASLTDRKIIWEEIDPLHIKAGFRNGQISVSAILTFNEEGRLIDFISNDRYETADGKKYMNNPWRTPVKDYSTFNGYRLPSKAEVMYTRPDGEYCYGVFNLREIKYNLNRF
jgi:hypothetical protein